jgi:hypothetical protein
MFRWPAATQPDTKHIFLALHEHGSPAHAGRHEPDTLRRVLVMGPSPSTPHK